MSRGISHSHVPSHTCPVWQKEAIEKEQDTLKGRLATEEKLTAETFQNQRNQSTEFREELDTVHKKVRKVSAELDNVPHTEFDPVAATPYFQPQCYPSVVRCWEHHRLVREREEEEQAERAKRRRVHVEEGSETEHYSNDEEERDEEGDEEDDEGKFLCAQRS